MSRVHVYPVTKGKTSHWTGKVADCWCEPRIEQDGLDDAGEPAIVYVHSELQDWTRKKVKR